jgi:hypothetical protein
LKKHRQNIKKYLSAFMVVDFAIALTTWSVLHNHAPVPVVEKEVNCKHVSHLQAHGDTCLICNASFEKNYVSAHHIYRIFLCAKIFNPTEPTLKNAFTEVKRTSLRGPPLA